MISPVNFSIEEGWKNQGFNWIRTRDLRDTGAMLYQLSYEVTHWEQGQFTEFKIWSREQGQFVEVISQLKPWYFQASTSLLLKLEIYCDDHSSLASTTTVQIWIISYTLHIISDIWREQNFLNCEVWWYPMIHYFRNIFSLHFYSAIYHALSIWCL